MWWIDRYFRQWLKTGIPVYPLLPLQNPFLFLFSQAAVCVYVCCCISSLIPLSCRKRSECPIVSDTANLTQPPPPAVLSSLFTYRNELLKILKTFAAVYKESWEGESFCFYFHDPLQTWSRRLRVYPLYTAARMYNRESLRLPTCVRRWVSLFIQADDVTSDLCQVSLHAATAYSTTLYSSLLAEHWYSLRCSTTSWELVAVDSIRWQKTWRLCSCSSRAVRVLVCCMYMQYIGINIYAKVDPHLYRIRWNRRATADLEFYGVRARAISTAPLDRFSIKGASRNPWEMYITV